MSSPIVVKLSPAEQARLRKELRTLLRGRLLIIAIVLLLSLGLPISLITQVLFCSRRTVYRARAHWLAQTGPFAPTADQDTAPACPLRAAEQRRRRSWLKKAPAVFGWRRSRWSCEALALTWEQVCGHRVSAETRRRWLHTLGFRWKRTKPAAKDNDPERASKLARILLLGQNLGPRQAMLWADELDWHLLAQSGYQVNRREEHWEVGLQDGQSIDPVVDLLRTKGLSIRHLVEKRQTLEELFMETVDALEPGVDARSPHVVPTAPVARSDRIRK